MPGWLNKSVGFFGAAVFGLILLIGNVAPVYLIKKNIKVVMKLSSKPIGNLNQKMTIKRENIFYLNTLNFQDGMFFEHPDWGSLGVTKNFYLDCSVDMTVKAAGKYIFAVGSDDGFRLWVNGKKKAEFINGRAYAVNRATVELPKGKHRIRVLYYQGGGWLGFSFKYRFADGPLLLIGKNSPWARFSRPGH